MRYGTILWAAASVFVMSDSAMARSPFESPSRKPKTALSRVKLVSVTTGAGREILVLSRQKTTFPVTFQKAISAPAGPGFKSPMTRSARRATVESIAVIQASESLLQPGQIVSVPTGATAVPPVDTLVVRPRMNAAAPGIESSPPAATVERQVFPGDLPRDTSPTAKGLTPGSVAGAVPAAAIGPIGFPIFEGATTPQVRASRPSAGTASATPR